MWWIEKPVQNIEKEVFWYWNKEKTIIVVELIYHQDEDSEEAFKDW